MSFARNIIRDLVDKRLWPFALLMVVAIVAIPLVMGGGSDAGSGDSSTPIAPAGATATSSAVELLPPPSVRKRAGKVVDPFRRKPVVDPDSTGASNTVVSGTTGGTTGGTGGGTTGGTTADPGTTDGSQDKDGSTVDEAGPSVYDLTKVADVRFGKRNGKLKRITNLAPLSELPSSGDSIVMFAGALKNKSVGRFIIVSNGGETTGDGECKTRGDACVSVDMEAGDRQYFRVDDVEYELQLVGINRVRNSGSTGRAYSTRVTFGSGSERAITRLARLGGSGDNPGVLYLGVFSDGKQALFVLGPTASAKSDGECMDGAACRVIGLRSGDSGTVTVGASKHRLNVKSVRRLTMSATAAARARARVASGGRDVLRNMLKHGPTANALSRFRYSTDTGKISREATRG